MAFRPGRAELATSAPDNRIILWEPGSGQPVKRWKAHPVLHVNFLAYSPNGSLLAARRGYGRLMETLRG